MTPTSLEPREERETVREEESDATDQPRPWTAPDFVERTVCAEIGAYSLHER